MEVVSTTIFSADLLPVEGSVAMIVIGSFVLRDRGNPDGVESHSLNVVEVVGDTLESATAENVESSALSG
jgi:hypothetical protein